MLFRGLIWFWGNGFKPLLRALGNTGPAGRITAHAIAHVLYPVFVYLPGMLLAFVAYLLYPPRIVDPDANRSRL